MKSLCFYSNRDKKYFCYALIGNEIRSYELCSFREAPQTGNSCIHESIGVCTNKEALLVAKMLNQDEDLFKKLYGAKLKLIKENLFKRSYKAEP